MTGDSHKLEIKQPPDRIMVGVGLLALASMIAGALAICLAIGCESRPAIAADDAADTDVPAGALLVESYEWHDADTPVNCRIRLPYGVILDEPRGIRAANYDAWEIGSRGGANVTDAERQRGRKALQELRLLSVGKSLYCVPTAGGKRDSFGRPLGQLWLHRPGQWIELGAWAMEHGHVRKP